MTCKSRHYGKYAYSATMAFRKVKDKDMCTCTCIYHHFFMCIHFFSDEVADPCPFNSLGCTYRYFVAVSEELMETLPIHVEYNRSKTYMCIYNQWRSQDFSDGGAQTKKRCAKHAENICHANFWCKNNRAHAGTPQKRSHWHAPNINNGLKPAFLRGDSGELCAAEL